MQPHYHDPLPLGESDGLPYSKGLMARALVTAGVGIEQAYVLATRLELDLAESGARAVELDRLEDVAADVLGEAEGAKAIARLRRHAALRSLDVPIVLLVGGATGTGKSMVATEAAHRLGITRVTSTDFIRQTIRAFFPAERMPSVHSSSFEAGAAGGGLEAGFLEQTRNVLVGVEAAIDRALAERWSMAIEGVHLVPGMIPDEIEGALVVHAVLWVETAEVHRTHFHVRDTATGGLRAMDKYLDRLAEIRLLQECIVERAERFGVPLIESSNPERAVGALLELVLATSPGPALDEVRNGVVGEVANT
jgi:2-phosphoglycerate kinase